MARRIICLLILFSIVVAFDKPSTSSQAQDVSSPLVLYDFETGTQGWTRQNAISKVEQSTASEPAQQGHASLKSTLDLTNSKSGDVLIRLDNPVDLTGMTIVAWIYAPAGIRGDPKQPNGLHLFAVDSSGRKIYGTWRNFPEQGWFQVTLTMPRPPATPGSTTTSQIEAPACGSLDKGFKPSVVQRIGVNIARPNSSKAVFRGAIYLDSIQAVSVPAATSNSSTYFYDFDGSLAASRQPSWHVLAGWNADALTGPQVSNGVLSATANFVVVAPPNPQTPQTQKGVLGIIYSPAIDLSHKDNTIISADVRFNKTAIQKNQNCPFVMSIMAYDDKKQKWFGSDDINVGTEEWTHISFDVADMVQYKPGTQDNSTDMISLDSIRQIAFQFWGNVSYNGQISLDNIAVGGRELPRPAINTGIVQAQNAQFNLNGQAFRFVGANAEYLSIEDSSTVVSVLDQAASTGIKVIRVWGFGEGCENMKIDSCEVWSRRFQPSPGQWNEAAFKHFDLVVAMAAERGIRLVVPFANNWKDYGGKPQYVAWLQNAYPDEVPQGLDEAAYDDLFYTNEHIKQWYKNYVAYFLSRTNSITNIRYIDDPTIFAWELINEPRAISDPTGATLHNWIVEMSTFIDNLDPNHMIGTGEEGWYIMPKSDADQRSTLPNGTIWQNLPENYWEYGISADPEMTTNGVDFISDHNSLDTKVCWQKGVDDTANPQCEMRTGVPEIDFASIHVYINLENNNILRGPYCDMKFSDYLCKTYDFPQNQALLWIDEHIQDANRLGKPLLMAEFGFYRWDAFGAYSNRGLPGALPADGVPGDWVPVSGQIDQSSIGPQLLVVNQDPNNQNPKRLYVSPFERARLFQWYLDTLKTSTTLGGVMFWNLGFEGFMEAPWEDANVLSIDADRPLAWQHDPDSDATGTNNCLMADPVNHGRYGTCVTYDPSKGTRGAFVAKEAISATDADWTNTPRVRFDIYGDSSAFVIVRLVAGADEIKYESVPVPVTQGWNTVTVDISKPVWRSASSQTRYDNKVEEIKRVNIRQVSIGLVGYTTPGSFYLNNVRFVYDDSYVVYPEDPALEVMKEAIYQFWR